jgi:hypothetical protein
MGVPQRKIPAPSLLLWGVLLVVLSGGGASAQTTPRPPRPGHKMRVKIDSAPQQAAIYVDSKEYGIEGYTPSVLRLPKGSYTLILELPGFRPVQRAITVTRSEGFVFTMERAARPSVLDVRSSVNDSATGGQLAVDGAPVGTVPARVEVAPGHHLVEVKKAGFRDYRDSVDLAEGDQRTLSIDMQAEAKKGSLLVTADVAGADVYVDGQRRDAAPALIGDLIEGAHTVEVRKDPAPPWKQAVNVVAGQQVKVEAKLQAQMAGSLRVVSSAQGAEVYIDGELKGTVNTEITGVRPGQHIVEVRQKGSAPASLETSVNAAEQRVVKIDLSAQAQAPGNCRLRVVSAVPDADVYVDGAAVGKAPFDRSDLAAGQHYVVVHKQGFADWKREVSLSAAQPVTLTADLSSSGTLKVLSNVNGASVFIDGQLVGRTPLTLDNVAAGDHLVEVKQSGYAEAKQPLRLEGGEQKILSADLASLRTGPTAQDLSRRYRAMSSFSGVTIEPGRFTVDVAGGFFPFGQLRLTVGALRAGMLGLDAGVELRTIGYFTDGGAHAKFQFLKAGPVAMGFDVYLGGGGGPVERNDFTFEAGLPFSLLFGELVRFTGKPYVQVYSDRLCGDKAPATLSDEPDICHAMPPPAGVKPRDRFTSARFILQAALEIAVHEVATIFFIFEGAPGTTRAAYTHDYSPGFFFTADPQIYGRIGVTFKF